MGHLREGKAVWAVRSAGKGTSRFGRAPGAARAGNRRRDRGLGGFEKEPRPHNLPDGGTSDQSIDRLRI